MKLEDFIKDNRETFDDQDPSGKLWKGIEKNLTGEKKSWWNAVSVWRAAAMILLGLCIYLFVADKEINSADRRLVMEELQDVEDYYAQQISEKVRMIKQFDGSDGLSDFTQDFQQLEAMYVLLKEEMKTRPTQKVKDALVLNLLIRIDLLNQQLENLETDKRSEENDSQT